MKQEQGRFQLQNHLAKLVGKVLIHIGNAPNILHIGDKGAYKGHIKKSSGESPRAFIEVNILAEYNKQNNAFNNRLKEKRDVRKTAK